MNLRPDSQQANVLPRTHMPSLFSFFETEVSVIFLSWPGTCGSPALASQIIGIKQTFPSFAQFLCWPPGVALGQVEPPLRRVQGGLPGIWSRLLCISAHNINQTQALQCFRRGVRSQGWEGDFVSSSAKGLHLFYPRLTANSASRTATGSGPGCYP